jgi:hypothetical protein
LTKQDRKEKVLALVAVWENVPRKKETPRHKMRKHSPDKHRHFAVDVAPATVADVVHADSSVSSEVADAIAKD